MSAIQSKKFLILTAIIAIVYVVATVYLMNAGLVKYTVFGTHSLSYKWNLLVALLAGMWTGMSRLSLVLLVIVALLTGANLTLVAQRLNSLRAAGGLRLVVGGSSLLGILGSGCATCGLPILAFLGLSGAIVYLPSRGIELSVIAIALLSFSLYVLLKGRVVTATCAVEPVKTI